MKKVTALLLSILISLALLSGIPAGLGSASQVFADESSNTEVTLTWKLNGSAVNTDTYDKTYDRESITMTTDESVTVGGKSYPVTVSMTKDGKPYTAACIDVGEYIFQASTAAPVTLKNSTFILFIFEYTDLVKVNIIGNIETNVYDGEEHTVSGFYYSTEDKLYNPEVDMIHQSDVSASRIDVGISEKKLNPQDFSNINFNFTSVEFIIERNVSQTISPRPVTLVSGDATKPYDGTPLTNDTVTEVINEGEGFVNGDGATYTFSGQQTEIGESDNTFLYTLNDGTKGDNYNIKQVYGKLTVTGKEIELDTIDPQTYSGKVLAPDPVVRDAKTGDTLEEGKDYTVGGFQKYIEDDGDWVDVARDDIIKPGTYRVKVTGRDGTYYQGSTAETEFLIEKVPLTITAEDQTSPYNGSTQGEGDTVYDDPQQIASKVRVEGVLCDGDKLAQIELFSQGDNADTYEITVKSAVINHDDNPVTDCYDITYVNGVFTISPAEAVIKVDSASKLQGDADPTFTGTVTGLFKDGDLGEISYERTGNNEEPGTYKGVLTAKYTANKNYTVSVQNGDFTIVGKPATLTFDLAGGTLDGKTGTITIDTTVGSVINLPQAPKREGYVFKYWKGSEYKAGAEYKVEGNHAFTAVWEKNKNPDNNNSSRSDSSSPKTGDSNHTGTWIILIAGAAACLAAALLAAIRYRPD